MVFDLVCVRSVLLAIEETIHFDDGDMIDYVSLNDLRSLKRLQEFDRSQVLYTCDKLHEAGYIELDWYTADDARHNIEVGSLTFRGHEFLENIREKSVWSKVKSVADDVGAKSLGMVSKIATSVLTQIIQHHLGITS